jgi:hypothetical protein
MRIFCKWEEGSYGSRFFKGSRKFAKSERAEEDKAGRSRSPSEEPQCERIAWPSKDPTISHKNITLVGGRRLTRRCIKRCQLQVAAHEGIRKRWFDPGSNRGPSVC